MPIFVILAHTEPVLLRRLVERLQPYPVVVHVDARVDAAPFRGLPRTTLVSDRVAARWGSYSIVEATRRLYVEALPLADPEDHVVLLSGQCYPARPVEELSPDPEI